MAYAPKPGRQLAVWKHSNNVWAILKEKADDDDIYRGNLSLIFYELDVAAHRSKVMKALKLMGRIEIIKRSTGSQRDVTETQLFFRDIPLSIEEFNTVVDEVYATGTRRSVTKQWLTDERVNDIAKTLNDLMYKVDVLERRLDGRLAEDLGVTPEVALEIEHEIEPEDEDFDGV